MKLKNIDKTGGLATGVCLAHPYLPPIFSRTDYWLFLKIKTRVFLDSIGSMEEYLDEEEYYEEEYDEEEEEDDKYNGISTEATIKLGPKFPPVDGKSGPHEEPSSTELFPFAKKLTRNENLVIPETVDDPFNEVRK